MKTEIPKTVELYSKFKVRHYQIFNHYEMYFYLSPILPNFS